MAFGSLRTRSHYSFLQGASSPWELAARAQECGHQALGLCDRYGVYGAVQLQRACARYQLRHVVGAQILVEQQWVHIIARTNTGYASLNRLLTRLHQQHYHGGRQDTFPSVGIEVVRSLEQCSVIVPSPEIAQHLSRTEWRDVYLAIDHQQRPGDRRRAHRIIKAAEELRIPVVLAPEVCYATADDYALYDLMTCIRLGTTIFEPHPERPVNDAQHLQSVNDWLALLPFPHTVDAAEKLISSTSVDLLPGYVSAPSSVANADDHLRAMCLEAYDSYHGPYREQYHQQLHHELQVIQDLGLSDFFLTVKEIIDEARRRRIRYSGRGSAANSLVAYLLGITHVCPIEHHLLFERFLHRGRKGMPDIDVDFDAERRQEMIEWMEERYGRDHTAMTATLITYRHRMAVQDCAKALGWSVSKAQQISKAIPGYTNKPIAHYTSAIKSVVGEIPLLEVLIRTANALMDRPRHIGLHSGGMLLTAQSLDHHTPVQYSANGVSVVQFNKDDVEAMGLIKFDVLGLRMLACISEAVELIERYYSLRIETDTLPLDDPAVYDLMCSSRTIGVFQVESQGQMHVLAQHQPTCFRDLVIEVAIFRPGPLQSGMVHPYIRRRKGLEPVTYLHPDLEPILKDTLGIVLFQEQVLEIAHHVAGMSLEEADDFRDVISKQRNLSALEHMQERFLQGACSRGIDATIAQEIFSMVAHFVGYGFCKSHAAAFARTVYVSAWLKQYYPAAYMAAFMQHRPGMYNLLTLEQEAQRCGVEVLPPCIVNSGVRYELTNNDPPAIRKPLTSIRGITETRAATIVLERTQAPFTSIEDLVQRTGLHQQERDAIAMSGALHQIEANRRTAMWRAGLYQRRPPQQPMLHLETSGTPYPLPDLAALTASEELAYDDRMHGAARYHPITLYRRHLQSIEVRTISTASSLTGTEHQQSSIRGHDTGIDLTVAGIVILRQSPPTAHGVLFVTLEDETGYIQCVVQPQERQYFLQQLRQPALIVRGRVYASAAWRGLVVRDVWVLHHVLRTVNISDLMVPTLSLHHASASLTA